jgi:hypothetical protein
MSKVIKISTANEVTVEEYKAFDSYGQLSEAVGGFIECVSLPQLDVDMWVNEEGKIRGEEPNIYATALWIHSYGTTDFIAGNIIITGGVDDEGNTLGLSDEKAEEILGMLP